MTKRILIFSLVYYPRFIGGAEVAVKEITQRIAEADTTFDLIALRLDHTLATYERVGNVNVYRVGYAGKQRDSSDSLPVWLHFNKYLYPFLACVKACSLYRKRKYDAVWAIMANYSGFAALFFKCIHRRVPFLLTLQEGDPVTYIKHRVRFVYPLFRLIFTCADYIQTISYYLADFARSMGVQAPIAVVPNGVNVTLFSDLQGVGRAEQRRKLGIQDNEKVIITTSRLVIKNAVGDIIASLRYLPERVKLLIIGTGYLEQSLRKQAASYQLQHRVSFLGFIPHDALPEYLHAADIFCRPSLSEGFGNSFIEAMAAGLPVITTPVGGIVDFLRDKETGLFCKVGDPKSIADAVLLLEEQPALREAIISSARRMVEQKYDWDIVAKQMRAVFEKSITNKR